MKTITTSIFILFISFTNAQTYYPLLRPNVYWDVFYYDGTQICNLSSAARYFLEGDTVMNGTDYKIIKGHPIISLLTQPSPFCWPFGVDGNTINLANYFMREDTSSQRVYVFNHMNNQEDLLYDFSLQIGDTINSFYPGQGSPFIIDSIGTYLMPDNSQRRIFYGTPFWSTEFYIEGIGSSTGLFHPLMWAIGAGSRLSCVSENSNVIYSDSLGAFGCLDFVGLEEATSISEFELYPNPASKILNIKSLKDSNGIFKLFDIAGRLIFETIILNSKEQIEIDSFGNGIYLYLLESKDKLPRSGKVVVQN